MAGAVELDRPVCVARQALKCVGYGNSLEVQWLGLSASTAGGTGSIPGWGTKIPKARRGGQRKKGSVWAIARRVRPPGG